MNMATKAHIVIFTFNYWCIHSVFKHVIVFLCLEQFNKSVHVLFVQLRFIWCSLYPRNKTVKLTSFVFKMNFQEFPQNF